MIHPAALKRLYADDWHALRKWGLIFLIFTTCFIPASNATEAPLSEEESCTTALAAGNATKDGSIILAKNRDLSEYELQWLFRAPRGHHAAGTMVKLQYIEIPQANVTWAWVGSKSYTKKWGVGMGINEWGVAVADNDAPTREPLEGERGLHDNDICRLILERARTAREGMSVAGELIEEYGHSYVGEIYWVADPEECWIVECAGHHWAAVRITDGTAVRANQFQITTRWDAGSEDLVEYAIRQGWCKSAEDFDFSRCYSKEGYPYRSSQTRLERGLDLLEGKVGDLTREDLIGVLRDHYEGTGMFRTAHSNQFYRTVCNKRTVSAMVVHLKPDLTSEMQLMWYCMSSPCISVFMPIYANVSTIPTPYLSGGGPEDISNYDPSSAWWLFKRLQLLTDEDYAKLHPTIWEKWDSLYSQFAVETDQMEDELLDLFARNESLEARQLIDQFVGEKLTEAYNLALQTVEEFTSVEEEDVEEEVVEKKRDKTSVYVLVAVFTALVAAGLVISVMKIGRGKL